MFAYVCFNDSLSGNNKFCLAAYEELDVTSVDSVMYESGYSSHDPMLRCLAIS
jgi:hypothetical protein